MTLAVEVVPSRTGAPDAPRLVMAHGFTQNHRCWGPLVDRLSASFDLVLVDMPGHGKSGHDEAGLDEAASLVADAGGRAHYLGYSMGGRVLLHLALAHPELVESLTLIGATAGLDDPSERRARRDADEKLAQRLESDGLASFLDFWLALDLFSDLSAEASCRPARETNRVEGLAGSLRHCGTGNQRPLWTEIESIEAPTLVIAGEADAKFRAIGERLVDGIGPNASMVTPAGRHAVHLSNPDQVAASMISFASELRRIV